MTIIDPRIGLAAALQAQAAARRSRERSATNAAMGEAPVASPALSLADRIRAIPADDPQRRGRAVRMFLESELLREFGGGLVNDPQFAAMVDAVHQQMRDDPAMAQATEALADVLLAEGAR